VRVLLFIFCFMFIVGFGIDHLISGMYGPKYSISWVDRLRYYGIDIEKSETPGITTYGDSHIKLGSRAIVIDGSRVRVNKRANETTQTGTQTIAIGHQAFAGGTGVINGLAIGRDYPKWFRELTKNHSGIMDVKFKSLDRNDPTIEWYDLGNGRVYP